MSAKWQVDVVLINPSSRTRVYQSLGNELSAIEPPLWTAMLATFCRHRSLSVAIIDAEAEELTVDDVAGRVHELQPHVAAVVAYGHQPSASTQTMTAAGLTCTAIKERTPGQNVMLLGGHVAALPERTLREEDCDFVAGGEGLYTLSNLVEAIKSGHRDLAKIPGLWFRDGESVRSVPDRALLVDLDTDLPGPAWDLLPMHRYRAHNWHCLDGSNRQPYASLYTTLGCPYHCSFCCIQAPFRNGERAAGLPQTTNSYRYWSPQAVLAQIDILVNQYGVRNIKIADEMFVLNRKHVLAICEGLIERHYDLNLWAYARVDTIKDGMLGIMRRAGFSWLALGIEAGAESVRSNVDKAFTQDKIFEVVDSIHSAGINVIGNFIFGLPDDDEETMQATFDLATELNCEFANFYCTMAYPGSSLHAQALLDGTPLPRNWTGYSQHSRDCLPLPTRHLTARDVLRFRDEAFHRYYTNPVYLDMIERRFGAEVVAHLRDMTSTRLQRDLLKGTLDVPLLKLPTSASALPIVSSSN